MPHNGRAEYAVRICGSRELLSARCRWGLPGLLREAGSITAPLPCDHAVAFETIPESPSNFNEGACFSSVSTPIVYRFALHWATEFAGVVAPSSPELRLVTTPLGPQSLENVVTSEVVRAGKAVFTDPKRPPPSCKQQDSVIIGVCEPDEFRQQLRSEVDEGSIFVVREI